MKTISFPPNSLGASLGGAEIGDLPPIAIPRELAARMTSAAGREEQRLQRRNRALMAVAVAVTLGSLLYAASDLAHLPEAAQALLGTSHAVPIT
jgi:alkylhydroperoxidase/carboxymuconolactone decarboxylase family protein YurZ